jgi:hypothetical protein
MQEIKKNVLEKETMTEEQRLQVEYEKTKAKIESQGGWKQESFKIVRAPRLDGEE